jgi:hypothetical protein
MATLLDVLSRARIALNDEIKVRYPDQRLLNFANAGIYRAIELRPDLNFGAYLMPQAELTLTSPFPFPASYLQTVSDYVVGRAQETHDVFGEKDSSVNFFQQFERALLT